MNYLAFNQGSSRPIPNAEEVMSGLVHMDLSRVVYLDHQSLCWGHLSMPGPKTCWFLHLTGWKLATEALTPQKLIFKPSSSSESPWRLKRDHDLEGKEPHVLPSILELKGTLEIVSHKPLISHLRNPRAGKSNDPAEKPLVSQPGILLLDHTPPVNFSMGADSSIT